MWLPNKLQMGTQNDGKSKRLRCGCQRNVGSYDWVEWVSFDRRAYGLGQPQIGVELTALHGIDHARTLAIVMPHLLEIKKEAKREKLIQYARHVWHLRDLDDGLVDAAIRKTTEFYESLGIPTKISAYGLGHDTIDKIVERLEAKGVNYGEHADITPAVVREILERSL